MVTWPSTNKCSAVAEMGDRLTIIDMGENWGYLGTLIHPDVWAQYMGQKVGAASSFFGGVESPSNTTWPGPSLILIHPTSQTDRTDTQTDRQPGQWSNGIG